MSAPKINENASIVKFIREIGAFCKTQDGYVFLWNVLCMHDYENADKAFRFEPLNELCLATNLDSIESTEILFSGIGVYNKEKFAETIPHNEISADYLREAFYLIRKIISLMQITKHSFEKRPLVEACFTELSFLVGMNGQDPVF